MTGEQIKTHLIEKGIVPSTVEHRGEKRIRLDFKNTARLSDAVRQLPGRKWSKTMGAWHIPKDKKLLEELILLLNGKHKKYETLPVAISSGIISSLVTEVTSYQAINIDLLPYLQQLKDKLHLKAYSYNTIKSYHSHFASFLVTIADVIKKSNSLQQQGEPATVLAMTIKNMTRERLEKYMLWRQKQNKYSESDRNQHINAIKFYYEQVLGKERMLFHLPRPKKPKQLPAVWAEEDVMKMIRAMYNLKHRTMLMMTYAHGMRVSEIASLRLADMDSKRMQIHIKAAKGKKDRIVNLSETALQVLKVYYKKYKPKVYLFENDASGEAISLRTIQEVFQIAKKRAGLNKKAGIHSLRHSYATHLHEQGVDIKFLKELLGHSNIKTTETYTHVSKKDISKIASPLDRFKI